MSNDKVVDAYFVNDNLEAQQLPLGGSSIGNVTVDENGQLHVSIQGLHTLTDAVDDTLHDASTGVGASAKALATVNADLQEHKKNAATQITIEDQASNHKAADNYAVSPYALLQVEEKADTALEDAEHAQSTADDAQEAANVAINKADTAQKAADDAQADVDKIQQGIDNGTIGGSSSTVKAPSSLSPSGTNAFITPTLSASSYNSLVESDVRAYREFQLVASTGDYETPLINVQVNADSYTPDWGAMEDLALNTTYKWRCRDVSQWGAASPWTEATFTTVEQAGIVTPTITSISGGVDAVPANPTITASEYQTVGITEPHASSEWRISEKDGEEVYFTTGKFDLTSTTVIAGYLEEGKTYVVKVRYKSTNYTSDWGELEFTTKADFTTIKTPVLTVEGEPDNVPETPVIASSDFAVISDTDETDTHVSTDWQIFKTSDLETPVWESLANSAQRSEIEVPLDKLEESTEYIVTCVMHGEKYTSDKGTKTFTTMANFTYIAAPTLSVEGAPNEVPEHPTLNGGAFTVISDSQAQDSHEATDWQVLKVSDSSTVWESLNDSTNKTTVQVPADKLTTSTQYKIRCRYKGTAYGWSEWTEVTATTMAAFEGDSGYPNEIGFGQCPCPDQDRLTRLNLVELPGTKTKGSAEWGMYQESTTGSKKTYHAPFWLKIGYESEDHPELGENYAEAKPYYAYASEVEAAADGYGLLPGFKNNGKVQGFFMGVFEASEQEDKYVSVQNATPVHSVTMYTMFENCKKLGEGYMSITVQQWAVINAISYLIGIHGNPAWKDDSGTTNFVKGNTGNGKCVDDSSISGNGTAPWLTGSGTPYNKTTHNGEACGITDAMGNLWSAAFGMTAPSDGVGQIWMLNTDVDATKITFGENGSMDAFGNTAHIQTLYHQVDKNLVDVCGRWGNSTNRAFFRAGEDGWEMNFILPKKGASSSSGTNLFGNDWNLSGLVDNLAPMVGGCYADGALAGIFARGMDDTRTHSHAHVGCRIAAY